VAGHTHASDHHEHDHHGHAHHGAPLVTALVLTSCVALVELCGGLYAHSLALMTDSAHVAMDALALGITVFAAIQARRPATDRRTFGYARFEMLAALANGALLLGVSAFVAIAAVQRFFAPELPSGGLMAAFAGVGFAVNVGLGIAFFRSAHGDLNVRAAFLHVVGDAAGALAIAIGGFVLVATGAAWIDPALSLLIVALIITGVVRIVREAAHVLLESAPDHATIPKVRARMIAREGVVGVHDVHVWTIGSGSHVLTAHVLLADKRISEASSILRDLESELHDGFGIDHVTIQFECESCEADDRIVCVGNRVTAVKK
jgi:cobalt-zinc-cadmium efflux system protein